MNGLRPRRRIVASLVVACIMLMAGSSGLGQAAPRMATITILHGLPKFTADVYVNGKLTLDGFKPETLTQPIQLAAGIYDVAIRNVGATADSEPAVEAKVTLEAGQNYSAIAHLGGTGTPGLTLFRNDLRPVRSGMGRLVVRNTADAGKVTIQVDGQAVATGLTPGHQRTRLLGPGTRRVDVISQDGTNLLRNRKLTLQEGTAAVIYVVGSASGQTLDLMFQELTDLSSAPGQVLTGSGGFGADPGFPAWATALMVASALTAGAALIRLRGARRWVALTVLSLVVLVATPVAWAMARPSADVGAIPASDVETRHPALDLATAARASLEHQSGHAETAIAVRSGRLSDQPRPPAGPTPVRIRIPSIAADGRVLPVGVEAGTDNVDIPLDVRMAGWYRYGPRPGDKGSAVIVGHVSSAAQGTGLFYGLRDLDPGSRILVGSSDGSWSPFTVEARRAYPKADLPRDLFVRTGASRLILVTCGGPYDAASGHYLDNVVVYAVPAAGT